MVISKEREFMVPWCVDHMLPIISSLFKFLILCSSLFYICSSASDTIMFNNSISDEKGETLISANGTFELGFFTPNESLSKARYVGIWYYNFTQQTVVWVANRDSPLSDRSGSFGVTEDGNLKVLDGKGNAKWSTGSESLASRKTAKLLDSGNLVLSKETSAAEIVWESFRHPTDTFLPGMIMDDHAGLGLTSWKASDNPEKGSFIFDHVAGEFMVWKDAMIKYWTCKTDPMPSSLVDLLSNYPFYDYSNWRVVMSSTGEIRYLSWDANKNWSLIWWAPKDKCGALNFCGKFGSCNINNRLVCKCLPGFHPNSMENWESGDFSSGCFRKSQICSKRDENETFLSLKMMKVRDADTNFGAGNETECRKKCLDTCNCEAYSYNSSSAVCFTWTEDLTNLQEEYGRRNISVRVYLSDIESTSRNCETCGTNMIPYPLSTGPQCGDPMYNSFHCNLSTGQLSFMAYNVTYNVTYRVTNINPDTQTFVIQAKDAGTCEARNSKNSTLGKILQLNPPFRVNNSCTADPSNFSSDTSFKSRDELELSWDLPREPTCTRYADCKEWPNSTCNYGKKRCICNANYRWNGTTLNCTQVSEQPSHGSNNQKGPSRGKKATTSPIIAAIIITLIVVFCIIIYFSYLRRQRIVKGRRDHMQHLYDSERRVKDLIDSDQFREEDKKGIDVPFFDLKSILVATDNFSDANKLGRGGFGPVYKGKFPEGREFAVKRLSIVSGQGLEEFKNEVILIGKLQHRNLVRLLGYCIKGQEKILLYEYMPNKSLDSFIFDQTLCVLLDWELRFNIILGIARGLLYLHQDSRLRIIHRDLKTSNVLLDKEMNPKISDFGLARIFEGKQIEANTNRVVGTYGYMSPEYANYGIFSVKSDVFSFGVVVLEIISGKKVTGFYQSGQELSLLGYAWRLWNEDKALDLMDQTLRQTCNTNEFLKCANIGLLCVQEDAIDRPTMSNVVAMLDSEIVSLSTPKQPAFIVRRDPSSATSSCSRPEVCSINDMTITAEEGR